MNTVRAGPEKQPDVQQLPTNLRGSRPPISASQLRWLQKAANNGQRSQLIKNAKDAGYDLKPYLTPSENELNIKGHALAAADKVGNTLLRAGYHGFYYATAASVGLGIPGAAAMLKAVQAAEDHERMRLEKRHDRQEQPFRAATPETEPASTGQQ